MLSDADLVQTIADLKEELCSSLSSLKREMSEEHDTALKKLKTAPATILKFNKKGNEKQFFINAEVLENVQSASSFLQGTMSQVEKSPRIIERR